MLVLECGSQATVKGTSWLMPFTRLVQVLPASVVSQISNQSVASQWAESRGSMMIVLSAQNWPFAARSA